VAPNVTDVSRVRSVITAPSANPNVAVKGADFDPTRGFGRDRASPLTHGGLVIGTPREDSLTLPNHSID
jgi:hypothetical protein